MFNMIKDPWFISFDNEQERDAIVDWLDKQELTFDNRAFFQTDRGSFSNVDMDGNVGVIHWAGGVKFSKHWHQKLSFAVPEIKLSFKNQLILDNVTYPETKSAKDLEIERIEAEMRKLTDDLKKIKGE